VNNGARVYARLARRIYPRTALQENDLAQTYLFGHRKKRNNGGYCGVSEIKDGKTARRRRSGDWMVLSARNNGKTARGTHEVRFGGGSRSNRRWYLSSALKLTGLQSQLDADIREAGEIPSQRQLPHALDHL